MRKLIEQPLEFKSNSFPRQIFKLNKTCMI